MASEKRLIDVNTAIKEMNAVDIHFWEDAEDGVEKCVNILHNAPTVDAVEVVRCRDCVHRVEGSKMCAHPKAIGWDAIEPEDDDFCSYGERKDNEQT